MAMALRMRLVVLFCCHATCSVSMVLLNKTISQGFDFPWTVIFMQNFGAILLGYVYGHFEGACTPSLPPKSPDSEARSTFLGMTVPSNPKNRLWLLAQSGVFIATLFTSLRALHYISVPLYVVARNCVPAATSMLEYCMDGTVVNSIGFVGIIVTVSGTVMYAFTDHSVEFAGFVYAVLQVLLVALASAVDKTSVRIQSSEENIEPVEVNQIRMALSMPVLLVLIGSFETFPAQDLLPDANAGTWAWEPVWLKAFRSSGVSVWSCMLVSTVFGFGMGTFNFCLQKEVNAATVQVANITYKLMSTIISRVTHPSPIPTISWLGYAVSLCGIAIYTFGPKLRTEKAADGRPSSLERTECKEDESDKERATLVGRGRPNWNELTSCPGVR